MPTSSWLTLAPMNTIRSHCGAAAMGGKLYVFGGGGPEFKSLQTVEIYDPKTDRWTFGPEMPTLRSGVVAVNLNEQAYVMGGDFGVRMGPSTSSPSSRSSIRKPAPGREGPTCCSGMMRRRRPF
ncbi:MAG: kelch repeat-containing protein [Candidatus Manganitrophus sp.]|nr:kelch repeat-containing protein [Candidatus Manganitrophus sp.]WDT70187.1 MAG: kelch repeat-containing protein [Candidatus Manganitrophus sp.]